MSIEDCKTCGSRYHRTDEHASWKKEDMKEKYGKKSSAKSNALKGVKAAKMTDNYTPKHQ